MTCRSDRHVYSALSAWGWVLFQWRSWRRLGRFRRKKFRNVNLRALKDAGRIFLGVFVKDVQSCQVKVNVCCKELPFCQSQWKVCYFTRHFLICLFPRETRNYECPWWLDRTCLVVCSCWKSLASLLRKLLDRFTVYLIRINWIISLPKSLEFQLKLVTVTFNPLSMLEILAHGLIAICLWIFI